MVMVNVDGDAVESLSRALAEQGNPISVTLDLTRGAAEKVLELLQTENATGAVVVPVKEQFTTTEAAKMLGISRTTLMKLIDAGEIDSVKVASHHRIPAPAISRYEHQQAVGREKAAEAIEDFANHVKAGFQHNVKFGGQE